jgi:hypothetical protein
MFVAKGLEWSGRQRWIFFGLWFISLFCVFSSCPRLSRDPPGYGDETKCCLGPRKFLQTRATLFECFLLFLLMNLSDFVT